MTRVVDVDLNIAEAEAGRVVLIESSSGGLDRLFFVAINDDAAAIEAVREHAAPAEGEEPLVMEGIPLSVLTARGMLEGDVLEASSEEVTAATSVLA